MDKFNDLNPINPINNTYNQNYYNHLIPVMTVVGPQDVLAYDSLQDKDIRYLSPVYYTKDNTKNNTKNNTRKEERNSDIFPEQYRAPAYFPYIKNPIYSTLQPKDYFRNRIL